MSDRLYKTIMCVSTVMLIIGLSVIFMLIHATAGNYMPKAQSTLTDVDYNFSIDNFPTDKQEIKKRVEKLFNSSLYKLEETELPACVLGEANLLTRKIKIDKRLNNIDFAFTLTHELIHINYMTISERFCNFKAFQLLYESGDDFLRSVALDAVHGDIHGYQLDDYSFVGYAEVYLRNHKEK